MAPPGVRGGRVEGGRGESHRCPGQPSARIPRRRHGRAAVCRQGRDRLHRRRGRPARPSARRARHHRAALHPAWLPGTPGGSARTWSPRSPSPSGPTTTRSATPATSGSGPIRSRPTWSGRPDRPRAFGPRAGTRQRTLATRAGAPPPRPCDVSTAVTPVPITTTSTIAATTSHRGPPPGPDPGGGGGRYPGGGTGTAPIGGCCGAGAADGGVGCLRSSRSPDIDGNVHGPVRPFVRLRPASPGRTLNTRCSNPSSLATIPAGPHWPLFVPSSSGIGVPARRSGQMNGRRKGRAWVSAPSPP